MDEIKSSAEHSDVLLFIATLGLVAATLWLVKVTKDMALRADKASNRQLCMQAWSELSSRYNKIEMVEARKALAAICWKFPTTPSTYGPSATPVLSFFEDLGMMHKDEFIDDRMARNTFGYDARRWWYVLKPFIEKERGEDKAGRTLYDKFENYVKWLERDYTVALTRDDLDNFLFSEKNR